MRRAATVLLVLAATAAADRAVGRDGKIWKGKVAVTGDVAAVKAATDAGIDPRWTGMCSAWASISPDGTKIAAEQSALSLMLGE